MSIERDKISKNLRLRLEHNPRINGLAKFRKTLEREYFSRVTVRNCSTNNDFINLVVEIVCPYNLSEMDQHLKAGSLAKTRNDPFTGLPISPLDSALFELQLLNDQSIDVEEFSIFLEDCSIVIKRIYQQSIQEQLASIFSALAAHLNTITENFRKVPFEIYIPVFEEDLYENESQLAKIERTNNDIKDYFQYWGLYFDHQEEATIYDLSCKQIFSGELYMLDH